LGNNIHQSPEQSLQPSWVEQDPLEILRTVHLCIEQVAAQLKSTAGLSLRDVRGWRLEVNLSNF
jgi:glycerol kinase